MKEIQELLSAYLNWFENPDETIPPALVDENVEIGFQLRGFASDRFICRFETEKVKFNVSLLVSNKSGEEDAEAIIKLALVSLNTPFEEKVCVRVNDQFANYNGGTLEDFLSLIDKFNVSVDGSKTIIYP